MQLLPVDPLLMLMLPPSGPEAPAASFERFLSAQKAALPEARPELPSPAETEAPMTEAPVTEAPMTAPLLLAPVPDEPREAPLPETSEDQELPEDSLSSTLDRLLTVPPALAIPVPIPIEATPLVPDQTAERPRPIDLSGPTLPTPTQMAGPRDVPMLNPVQAPIVELPPEQAGRSPTPPRPNVQLAPAPTAQTAQTAPEALPEIAPPALPEGVEVIPVLAAPRPKPVRAAKPTITKATDPVVSGPTDTVEAQSSDQPVRVDPIEVLAAADLEIPELAAPMPKTVRLRIDEQLDIEITADGEGIGVVLEGSAEAVEPLQDIGRDLQEELARAGFHLSEFSAHERERDDRDAQGAESDSNKTLSEVAEAPEESTRVIRGTLLDVIA